MSIPTLTFFNNKGGVGKTTLVYHLSWMFSELGIKTVVVDCDPQANLTASFIDENSLFDLWTINDKSVQAPNTIFQGVRPLTRIGDYVTPNLYHINSCLSLIAGDLALSSFEDQLSEQWAKALDEDANERAMLVLSAFWRMAQDAAKDADLIIFDVGPNLGAINRSVLMGSDFVVIPLAADMFSLQGLSNLGPALRSWRNGWSKRLDILGSTIGFLPSDISKPLGYVALQHQERLNRPIKAFSSWLQRIPVEYQRMLDPKKEATLISITEDPNCLALLRHYKSLIPLAQEARKPVFKLTPSDGAFGGHVSAVKRAYDDFETLAKNILIKMGVQKR
jgi:chromosome partitioning protein